MPASRTEGKNPGTEARKAPAPLTGILWDQGGLTKQGATRFASLADSVTLTSGPRQETLKQAVGGKLTSDQEAPSNEPLAMSEVLASIQDRTQGSGKTPATFLGTGAPFDPNQWSEDVTHALSQSQIEGLVVIVPGPSTGPLTMVPLTEAARSFVPLIQSGIAGALGHTSPGTGPDASAGPTSGARAAANALENSIGDVALVYAANPFKDSRVAPPKPKVGAADVVHVIMKDTGLEATNRTDMPIQLRIHLGKPGGAILETLEVFLEPRSARFFTPEELGSVGLLQPPTPELRQWSHEAEVVYEGGERRIHLVEVHYLAPKSASDETESDYQVIGTDQFGSPDAVVSGTVSTEISRATRNSAHSMGKRMASLATRQDWRHVLQDLTRGQ